MEELETRLRNARRDAAENEGHPRRYQEIRDLVRQYEEELQRRPMRPPEPPAPPPAQPNPETFDREAIRDREYPLSKTDRHREMKAFLERLRDRPLDAADEAQATELAQQLWDSRKSNRQVAGEIDQFRMLLALRRAELFLGSPITVPVTIDDIKSVKALAYKQLIEDLKTRDIKNSSEYAFTDNMLLAMQDAIRKVERQSSDDKHAQLKRLKANHEVLLTKRLAFRRGG